MMRNSGPRILGLVGLLLLAGQTGVAAQEAGPPLGPVEAIEKIAPDGKVSRPSETGKPTEVWLQIYVIDVDDVN
jgi:hypothetical protein